MTVTEIEVKKKPSGFCEAEDCKKESLFGSEFCWNHLTEEGRIAYREEIEEKFRAGKDLPGAWGRRNLDACWHTKGNKTG